MLPRAGRSRQVLCSRAMARFRVRFTVEKNYAGWRLDRYLQEKIRRLSRERIQRLIETRLEHEGGARLKPATRVAAGMRFALLREAVAEDQHVEGPVLPVAVRRRQRREQRRAALRLLTAGSACGRSTGNASSPP